MAEPELLIKFIILSNKSGPLYPDILSHSVHFAGKVVTQIKSNLNPGQWVTTDIYITEGLIFQLENYALCFAFGRILIHTVGDCQER